MNKEIIEYIQSLANNADRLIAVKDLQNTLTELEKSIKKSLNDAPIKHSRLKYIERKTWKPSPDIERDIKVIETQKKALIQLSKDKNQGSYQSTKVIQVVSPPKENLSPEEGKDYSDFFGL